MAMGQHLEDAPPSAQVMTSYECRCGSRHQPLGCPGVVGRHLPRALPMGMGEE
jgi:hypothetical protein